MATAVENTLLHRRAHMQLGEIVIIHLSSANTHQIAYDRVSIALADWPMWWPPSPHHLTINTYARCGVRIHLSQLMIARGVCICALQ